MNPPVKTSRSSPPPATVHIHAPARLHLGFLDLHGGLGRRFGSLGLSIDGMGTELTATKADTVSAVGSGADRALQYAREFMSAAGLQGGVRFEIRRAIREHAGLGSGTQLALAVGTALSRLHGLAYRCEEIAAFLDRGRRSGVGIGTFAEGGFIVDGGRGPDSGTPPVVCRMTVPDAWRFLLIMDSRRQGLSGEGERDAFARLGAMSEAHSGEVCRLVMMRLLPALAERDCAAFGAAVTRVQEIIGDCFAAAQSGRFSSPDVAQALLKLKDLGAAGIGQSSWGPTGFAVFASETGAFQALRDLRAGYADDPGLDFVSCRARNVPADVRMDAAVSGKSGRR